MTNRSASILLGAATLILIATFDLVTRSDAATLAWLVAAITVFACIIGALLWIVIRPLWAGGGFGDVESLFWIAFLALPLTAWLMYAAIWNLLDWYRP